MLCTQVCAVSFAQAGQRERRGVVSTVRSKRSCSEDISSDLDSAPGLLLKYSFPSWLCNPSHPLAVVDYQVSAELSTFMNPVPVFASPSAHGIKFILGSKGQERAKFEFVQVSADFTGLFSHVLQHLV